VPTTVPYWKLHRLARRAARVAERRAGDSTALAVCRTTLVPAATAYIKVYDEAQRYEPQLRREMREGRSAVARLESGIREWLPLIARDVPDFDRTTFADSRVPDDLLNDGGRLLETAEGATDEAGEPLAFADDLISTLGPVYEAARKEWAEAEAADSTYQQLLASVRQRGGVLHEELKAFRRTLAVVAGRSDKDYQKLRVERAGVPDQEDDDPQAPAPEVVAPAPANP
jgi:hypothetical protein